jgi:hypothetical protein
VTRRRRLLLVLVSVAAALVLSSCATAEVAAPRCGSDERVGIVAQAVPGATFVPCIAGLPPGWSVGSYQVRRGEVRFALRSDRAAKAVDVRFDRSCDVRGATAVAPRDEGVRTYLLLDTISPQYAGRMLDVFPGGCVSYSFAFDRGPHLALTDELQSAIDLYPRRELRHALQDGEGITLDR